MPHTEHRISLIIPVRLTAATHEGRERLLRICQTVPRDLFEIVVSDYGTLDSHAGPLAEVEAMGVRIARHPKPQALFSIGKCRDFGVQMASHEVVMFNDLDFLCDTAMYRAIHAQVVARDMARNRFDFFCVPVMFLTEAGTAAFLSGDASRLFSSGTLEEVEAAGELVQSTAHGSSAMVINKAHYLSVGGHDQGFRGHGAEDYELLHRLSSLTPKSVRPHDYLTDYRHNGVRNYWGFRAFFALYGLDLFAKGIRMVHLYHPRRPEKGYFRARQNFRILKAAMKRFDATGRHPDPLPDLAKPGRLLIVAPSRELPITWLRQILPLHGSYDIIRPPGQMDARTLLSLARAHRADRIIALSSRPESLAVEPACAGTGIDVLSASHGPDGRLYLRSLATIQPPDAQSARQLPLKTRLDRPIPGFFDKIVLPGGETIESGALPAPEPADSALFSSFGGPKAFDRKRHKRPKRARKSSLLVRLRRFLSGF